MAETEARRDGHGPPPETTLALAAGLGLLMGVQLLRVYLPLATFYLHDSLGLSPLATGGISLMVLAVGLGAPALARRHSWWETVRWTAGLLALTRIAEQLFASPAADSGIALVGTALLALLLPLILLATTRPAALRTRLAFVVVAALALETALRTLAGTLDLSWQDRPAADLVVLASAAACLLATLLARRPEGPPLAPASRPWDWIALGAWLAVYLLVFSNPAQLAARAALPLARASYFVLGGWGLAILLLGVLPLHGGSRWRTLEASVLAAAGTWLAVFGGDAAWFGILIGTPGMAVLLFDLVRHRPAVGWWGFASGAAGMVTLLLLYLAYGRFDQAFGPSERVVYLTAIVLLVVPSLVNGWRARQEAPRRFWRTWLGGIAAAAIVAAAAPALITPLATPPVTETAGPIRIMTYNLHQGFDTRGRLDPEALAAVVESEDPDVLAFQEVARGWMVTGGLDLYSWMIGRLGLGGRFAGTADPQWGNALLTRLPILDSTYHPLPPFDLPLRRGVLDVRVRTRRGPLRLLAVHLHHRRGDHQIRDRQVEALLEVWGGSTGTVLLGDFNALPGSAAIERLRAAGLRDASALLPPSGRGTTASLDGRQIDWIFATTDLAFETTTMRYSQASDHLPVVTTVHLTTRFRGASPPTGAAGGRRPPG